MKRVTVVAAAAVIFAALLTVTLASAQDNSRKAPAGPAEKKVKTLVPKESPDPLPTPGPTPWPTPSYDKSTHTLWDSTELQTQIGTKNKDKKKLVMQVWCEYSHDSPTTYSWQVRYTIRAENKDLTGPGWHTVGDLYGFDYNLTYKVGSGAPVNKSGSIDLNGDSRIDGGLVAFGSNAPAVPTFTTNHFTGKRGGGSSGINLDWP